MANEKKGLVDITTGAEVTDANANGILDLTSDAVSQIDNIGSATISSAQWGYLGNMDQDVNTTSSVQFLDASMVELKATTSASPYFNFINTNTTSPIWSFYGSDGVSGQTNIFNLNSGTGAATQFECLVESLEFKVPATKNFQWQVSGQAADVMTLNETSLTIGQSNGTLQIKPSSTKINLEFGSSITDLEINNNTADVDIAFFGTGTTPVFFLDAANENVGIGIESPDPSYQLSINNNVFIGGGLDITANLDVDGTFSFDSGTAVNEIVTSISGSSTDSQLATAKSVYDAVQAENLWNRAITTLSTANAGDNVRVDNNLIVANSTVGTANMTHRCTTTAAQAEFSASITEYNVNSNGLDVDFVVQGDTVTNLFKTDAGNEQVECHGGQIHNVTTVNAATYDLLSTDYILHVTYTSTGAVTSLTLPTAQTTAGRVIIIKDAGGNALANNITIDTEGTQKIDGQDTYVISSNYQSISIYCDGSNWFII